MKRMYGPASRIVLALVLSSCLHSDARAQVIEERQGEANPSAVMFHATLYGTGTGLILGGAHALVEDNDDLSTGEILKWSIAGGAAAGFLVGLVYVVARPAPTGDTEKVGMRELSNGPPRVGAPGITWIHRRGRQGQKCDGFGLKLVHVTF